MTWSIVARDPQTGVFGVAVSSCVIAVGAMCPMFRPGVAALSTQSYTSPVAGERMLDLLAAGNPASDTTVATALADDRGHAWRQIHGVDSNGRSFGYTGTNCVDWHGHWSSENVSIAGNMLAGPKVLETTAETWRTGSERPFADRLLTALAAGQSAGGDKRGRQSAAIKVVGREVHAEIDLRVDDHPDPIEELRRIFDMFWADRRPYMATLPTRDDPSGIFDPDEREAYIAGIRSRD